MLEMEQRITQWRQALARAIGADPNVLDELESHLRDEMDRLIRQGQTPAQAVEAAIEKLGTPQELGPEFDKLARPWWPIHFVLGGTLLLVGGFLAFIGYAATRVAWDGVLLAHLIAVTTGYLLTYSIGVLAVCYALRRMVQDLSAPQQTSWTRTMMGMSVLAFVLTLAGVVLGGVWANGRWGRFWSWDLRETGGLLTLLWQAALLVSLWRFPRSIRWLMCWGVLGNVVVTFAWFVTGILGTEAQVHAYGKHGSAVLLLFAAVTLTHLLVMGGGIAPSGWLRLRKRAA